MNIYEHLKGFTLEEMAQLLLQCPCDFCYFNRDECGHAPEQTLGDCKAGIKWWLEREVEND